MKHFTKILFILVTLLTGCLLVQTDLYSQDTCLPAKESYSIYTTENSKGFDASISFARKDTSKRDSNTNQKKQIKKTKKSKDFGGFFFSSLGLGGSIGSTDYMQGNFTSLRMTAGYWSKSFPIPLSFSAAYSKEIMEEPAMYQADVGVSVWLPWGEHFPFLALELGGGVAFGNVRIINESIINQKIDKIESTENFTSPYFSASVELLFTGIGDDFLLGFMCSYTKNSKRAMTSFALVVHYAKLFNN